MLLAAGLVAAVVLGVVVVVHHAPPPATAPDPSAQQQQQQPGGGPPPPAPSKVQAQRGLSLGSSQLGAAKVLEQVGSIAASAVQSSQLASNHWSQDNAAAIGAGIGLGAFAAAYLGGIALLSIPGLAVATAVVVITEAAISYVNIAEAQMRDAASKAWVSKVQAKKDGDDYWGAWQTCLDAAWAMTLSSAEKKLPTAETLKARAAGSWWGAAVPAVPDAQHASYRPGHVTFDVPGGGTVELEVSKILDLAYAYDANSTAQGLVSGAVKLTQTDWANLKGLASGALDASGIGQDSAAMMQRALAAGNVQAVAQYYGDYWAASFAAKVPWLSLWAQGRVTLQAPPFARQVVERDWWLSSAQVKQRTTLLKADATAEAAALKASSPTAAGRGGAGVAAKLGL